MAKRGDANLDLAFLEQPLQARSVPLSIGTGLPPGERPVATITLSLSKPSTSFGRPLSFSNRFPNKRCKQVAGVRSSHRPIIDGGGPQASARGTRTITRLGTRRAIPSDRVVGEMAGRESDPDLQRALEMVRRAAAALAVGEARDR